MKMTIKEFMSISIISFITACSIESNETITILSIKAEKDSLLEVRAAINDRLAELESELLLMDSNMVYDAVTSLDIMPEAFYHYFEVFGTVEADKSINLYPTASGRVENIHVRNGQVVKKGQLLISLDAALMKSSLNELNTGLDLAKTVYEKQERLWLNEQVGSEIQYLQAKNNYEGLVQKVKTLKEQIALSEIRAPFSGSIDNIFYKEGELALPQSPSIRLVNTSGVYVKADVPENYSNRVRVGMPANVQFSSMDYKVVAEVLQVGQFIKKGNRTFSINVSLPKAKGVKPNQMVHVALQDYRNNEALTVPASLVQQDVEGNDFIYTLAPVEGEKHFKVIKTWVNSGLTYEGKTEIISGLKAGMKVVYKGSRSVRNNQKVVLS